MFDSPFRACRKVIIVIVEKHMAVLYGRNSDLRKMYGGRSSTGRNLPLEGDFKEQAK